MWVIVMEYIEGGKCFDMAEASFPQTLNLKLAVDLLHKNHFVFGDLREPNIIIRAENDLFLVDFDWCGLFGTTEYPLDIYMGPGINWPEGVAPGATITEAHDNERMKDLLDWG